MKADRHLLGKHSDCINQPLSRPHLKASSLTRIGKNQGLPPGGFPLESTREVSPGDPFPVSGDPPRRPLLFPFARASEPVALFSFDEVTSLETHGSLQVVPHGPTSPEFPALPAQNCALAFQEKGAYLAVPDAEALRFANGDTLTLTAWVFAESPEKGAHAYVIGKGRTDPQRENQN